jgi:hypothetical protein
VYIVDEGLSFSSLYGNHNADLDTVIWSVKVEDHAKDGELIRLQP